MATTAEQSSLMERPRHYFLDIPPDADPFRLERRMAMLVILCAAWYVRAMNAAYSSAYMDESVYVVYGRMFLSRHFEAPIDQPLRWTFGWYLWPMMAAIADRLAGIVGVRELAALLGTGTVAAVYGFARRVFSPAVAVGSAAVFALLAPAVYTSRIATRDSGAIFFFAVGLWLFARAWQEDRPRAWLVAALALLAAFLCKYVVAIAFPFLVLLALKKKTRPLVYFTLPMVLVCAAYAIFYRDDLSALLTYGGGYGSLRAPTGEVWRIYFWNRLDFWILAVLACFSFLGKTPRGKLLLVWLGAAIFLVFQWATRADYDFWKHAVYPLLFVTPLAIEGLLALFAKITRDQVVRVLASATAVLILCGTLAWVGRTWLMEQFVFWPNVEPMLAYTDGRLAKGDRVLVDDTVFRYYFHPLLQQKQIVDPFYFWYQGQTGGAAYTTAVADGSFQYILLDGGVGDDAKRLQSAVRPALAAHYERRLAMPDPQLDHAIEIWARKDVPQSPIVTSTERVAITSPQNGSLVKSSSILTNMEGTTRGAGLNWRVRVQVFTNHWYDQPQVQLRPDGSFSTPIYLGGEGSAQCHHLIRAELYDPHGRLRASDVVANVARTNSDGSPPLCK